LLACIPADKRAAMLARPLSRDTRATATSATEVERQVQLVLASGLAFDLEEHTEGICAVGTSFIDAAGRAYALSIPVPKMRYDNIQGTLAAPLIETRNRIVAQIDGLVPRSPASGQA
jgi:DNA-binding IclR family transcriptional regulator